MREFNRQTVELLAPCGNYNIFLELLDTEADAFYFGGKQFNMRMHRKDFNFTLDEIKDAIFKAHERGKKIYITLNNLLDAEDLETLDAYLIALDVIHPDALIVQDLAVIERVRSLGLALEIHASVMMNVHNLEMIHYLRQLGVTRVVVSRDVSLSTVKTFSLQSDMELEYFVHGDMCAVHGSQCHYSGMLFGKSSNRGLCMKPCRWHYEIEVGGSTVNTTYPMAVKDMYMYENIPELMDAGVISFKIEGRMRDADYLKQLITAYSDAITRYVEDPIHYDRRKDALTLYDNRKRDFSTARALGEPGLSYINERYEGTGKFYSTGKPFSHPVPEHTLEDGKITQLEVPYKVLKNMPKLSVRVNDIAQALTAMESGADRIYLSMEPFLGLMPPTREAIKSIVSQKKNCEVYLALPRMNDDTLIQQYLQYFKNDTMGIDGVLIGHFGWLNHREAFPFDVVVDYTMNVYNTVTHAFLKRHEIGNITASIEMKQKAFSSWLAGDCPHKEVIVQGHPTMMYMDQNLFDNLSDQELLHFYQLDLVDEKGIKHPVYKDCYDKNHYMSTKSICLIPVLMDVMAHVSHIRIEGCVYSLDALKKTVKGYKAFLNGAISLQELNEKIGQEGTLGALHYL